MNTELAAKLKAAQALLIEPTTSRDKFTSIRILLKGINPRIDTILAECDGHISSFEKAIQGNVIELTAEHLPESTEEEKRRKKALLLFLNSWNSLKSEVARVQAEISSGNTEPTPESKGFHWGRIFHGAKGPLGLITIAAIGVVITMQQTAITMTIQNNGCGTLQALGSKTIAIPGLKIPSGTIENGSSVEAVLPPLMVSVDGTVAGVISLKALSFTFTVQLPKDITDVLLDDQSLLDSKKELHLADSKKHALSLVCQ